MKRIPLTLIYLCVFFNVKAQLNYSKYNLIRAEIYFRNPHETQVLPSSPEDLRRSDDFVFFKVILGIHCNQLFDLYENVYLQIKKVNTGSIRKNQAAGGLVLIDFFFYNKNGKLERNSIFIEYNGRYLLNESEIEFEKEEKMIEFIKEMFPISKQSYFKS